MDPNDLLNARFEGKRVRIYEAAGGSTCWLPAELLKNAHIVVVDLDRAQLENNRYADVKIMGDIQSYSFPAASFDLIVCFNVIEHLERPDEAIRRFYDFLAPGGTLFIGAPNPRSLSGFMAKYSPHWCHVWYYRFVLQKADAGAPGQPPFPVVYHPIVVPESLISFCSQLGLRLVRCHRYESPRDREMLERRPLLRALFWAGTSIMNLVTGGELRKSDYWALFEKPALR
jgi:SAM-dependent methyltransferase